MAAVETTLWQSLENIKNSVPAIKPKYRFITDNRFNFTHLISFYARSISA